MQQRSRDGGAAITWMGGANMPREGLHDALYRTGINICIRCALEFILFSGSNCHLCEAMEDELSPFIEKYDITVKRRYIDNKPVLEQRYGAKVPVLTFHDEILCEYFLDAEKLLSIIAQDDG